MASAYKLSGIKVSHANFPLHESGSTLNSLRKVAV